MKDIETIRRLAKVAADEEVEMRDVAPAVIATLSLLESHDLSRSWSWIAGMSLAATLPVAVIAYATLDAWLDTLQAVLFTFRWMMS